MKRETQTIDPNKTYSLKEIANNKLVPGMSYFVLRSRVLEDESKPQTKRTINALKVGEGRGRKYFILGRNLLKFIEAEVQKIGEQIS